jgi:hypothetical protein
MIPTLRVARAWLSLLAFLSLGQQWSAVAQPLKQQSSTVQVSRLSISPTRLTLPSDGFHYDPLITAQAADGKPVWANLPTDFRATSSDTEVATVDSRVRIRTGRPGTTTITIRTAADPRVQVSLELTVVEATVDNVQIVGDSEFDLTVGESRHLEATARLSTGHAIPHCEYSSDLDVVTGHEFATMVDGLGLAALRPCPPGIPIAIGFWRGGATAPGRLWVRPAHLTRVELSLGGKTWESQELTMPSGSRAVLEVVGTFHDGSTRPLEEGREYTVSLRGEAGYRFHRSGTTNGYLTQAAAGRSTELAIDLREDLQGKLHSVEGRDLAARVTTIDGSALRALAAAFARYPEDHRLLAPGYARELNIRADFADLPGYRVSAFDNLSLASDSGMGCRLAPSANGWPALGGAQSEKGGGILELRWGNVSANLAGVSVVVPERLEITPWGEPLSIELGGSLSWRTLVDYGDGLGSVDRAGDYPVLENSFDMTDGVWGGWRPQPDNMRYIFKSAREFKFQARDAERRPLQPVGPGANTTIRIDSVRQSDAGRPIQDLLLFQLGDAHELVASLGPSLATGCSAWLCRTTGKGRA